MPTLTLKNIPEPLLADLRKLAKEQRRSLTQQALFLIEGGLAAREPKADAQEASAQLLVWRDLAGQWESDQSVEEEIADIYDARTEGREVKL